MYMWLYYMHMLVMPSYTIMYQTYYFDISLPQLADVAICIPNGTGETGDSQNPRRRDRIP